MNLTLLAKTVGAEVYIPPNLGSISPDEIEINDIAPADTAKKDQVTFYVDPKYFEQVKNSDAQVFITQKIQEIEKIQLLHPHPRLIMCLVSQKFYQKVHSFEGISDMAYVHPEAKVDESATLFPFCYVGKNAQIGKNTFIYAHPYIGENVVVGSDCAIYPSAVCMDGTKIGNNVIVHGGAVIGGDGFGFIPTGKENLKVPQRGTVQIDENCEIGPLVTVDRATFDKTWLKSGSKLDSQVHLGHNVELGKNALICGQTGIAGSVKIGDNFITSGQVAVGPGLTIPDKVTLGPKTGMSKSVEEPGEYVGFPAIKAKDWRRQTVNFKKLPELFQKVRELEKKLNELTQNPKE